MEVASEVSLFGSRRRDRSRVLTWVASVVSARQTCLVGALSGADVTFLFTDVEGSTPLWERQPQDMARALAAHDGLVRSVVEMYEQPSTRLSITGAGKVPRRHNVAAVPEFRQPSTAAISPDDISSSPSI